MVPYLLLLFSAAFVLSYVDGVDYLGNIFPYAISLLSVATYFGIYGYAVKAFRARHRWLPAIGRWVNETTLPRSVFSGVGFCLILFGTPLGNRVSLPFAFAALYTLITLIEFLEISFERPLLNLKNNKTWISNVKYYGRGVILMAYIEGMLLMALSIFMYARTLAYLGLVDSQGHVSHGFGDAIYFSVVTWTTVGYGDLVPAVGTGRFVAAYEAFAGYTSMVLMVSALTALGRATYGRLIAPSELTAGG